MARILVFLIAFHIIIMVSAPASTAEKSECKNANQVMPPNQRIPVRSYAIQLHRSSWPSPNCHLLIVSLILFGRKVRAILVRIFVASSMYIAHTQWAHTAVRTRMTNKMHFTIYNANVTQNNNEFWDQGYRLIDGWTAQQLNRSTTERTSNFAVL